jgi:catabolite repression HPr-like protein
MKKEVTVKMENSMEATPIAHLVQLANQYSSQIYFEVENVKVNAKSIMGMMSLVLSTGNEVTLNVEGEDETEAVEALERFLTE